MDFDAFYDFTYSLDFDKSMCSFWAPETPVTCFFSEATAGEIAYVENCIKALDKIYDGRGDEILHVAMILYENCESFKNRLNGTIKDEWLTEKTFGPIAKDCVTVLDTLPKLEDWQVELRNLFQGMKKIDLPVKKQPSMKSINVMNFLAIASFLEQSYNHFSKNQYGMMQFTRTDIPLDEILEVYNYNKETLGSVVSGGGQEIWNDIRCAVGGDGVFCLVYMKQKKESDKQQVDQSADNEITTIVI